MEQLRSRYKELSEKVEQRKKPKTSGPTTNGNGSVGRGERLNAAQRERMRLLTTAALDRGRGEETFGAREEDWQLYKLMSRDNDNDEDDLRDDDEAELSRISAKLQEIDSSFVSEAVVEPSTARTAEDYRILIGVERFRCPEILFRPTMVGVDQAGIDEMVGVSLRRMTAAAVEEKRFEALCESILLTGGGCLLPGMGPRLEGEVRKLLPVLSPIKVFMAADPLLDAWRGAAGFAAGHGFARQAFTREDYLERGEDWLRRYRLKYV